MAVLSKNTDIYVTNEVEKNKVLSILNDKTPLAVDVIKRFEAVSKMNIKVEIFENGRK